MRLPLYALLALCLLGHATALAKKFAPTRDEKPKNPFGLKVEPKLDDEAAAKFARTVTLGGGARDPNAATWPTATTEGKAGSLAGNWSGRWKFAGPDKKWINQTKATKVAVVGNRVYMLFTYFEGTYLIVARRVGPRKDLLAGQYIKGNGKEAGF